MAVKNKSKKPQAKEDTPATSDEELDNEEDLLDSGDNEGDEDNDDDDNDDDDNDDDDEGEDGSDDNEDDDTDDDEFEQQSESDSSVGEEDDDSSVDSSDEMMMSGKLRSEETKIRSWVGRERSKVIDGARESGSLGIQQHLHTDDLSSDDEEDSGMNTIGRVPLHWYDAYDHIGYNVDGQKLAKRKTGDRIDQALENSDDPAARRTIYDMYNDRKIVLSEREIEIIRRVQAGTFAHPEHDDTPDYVDYFTSEHEVMPLSAAPEPKRRFVPSKWEMMRVMKIVKAIKEGRYKEGDREDKDSTEEKAPVYLIWNDAEDETIAESKKHQFHLPAPKMPLPGHAESYNPPAEYILSEKEVKEQEDLDPADRQYDFLPKKHDCLRHVAGYEPFLKERFERCLDLYLCPRKLKKRLNIDPETLVPRLPQPKELKPFPNTLCLQYLGHSGPVRSLSVSTDGQYLATASDDGTVRLWEVDTCYCKHVWDLDSGPVVSVVWNPNPSHHILACSVGSKVVLITTGTGDADSSDITETQLSVVQEMAGVGSTGSKSGSSKAGDDKQDNDSDNDEEGSDSGEGSDDSEGRPNAPSSSSKKDPVKWQAMPKDSLVTGRHGAKIGPRVMMQLSDPVTYMAWHYKGDYMATLTKSTEGKAVAIHQLSKGKTQHPFSKSPGRVQAVCFHPSRPFLFVVTQQQVKLFHLVEQKLVKKLMTGCKWLSSIDVHPSGDHVIVGSYDRRVVWFDLDLSSAPYKTLKFHEKAVRSLNFHRRYPLMASASDDGRVHVFHSMVYSDLTRNPLIVPLKVLKGHGVVGGVGVLSVAFHPQQPWIFSAGADSVVNLYQDVFN